MGAHIDKNGQFQSDKYPTCPAGTVPLSVKDASAQDLLWQYAQRRRVVDAEFSADLEAALRAAGYDWPKDMPPGVEGWDVGNAALALTQRLEHAGQQLPFEILKLEQETASIIIDQDGVDYVLTMQRVPAQRPRQTRQ